MHAAGILRDVAADGAGHLAGGIRGIVKAARRHGLRHRKIGDAGLHHREPVVVVELEDAVQPA